jgi:hypothetical protein
VIHQDTRRDTEHIAGSIGLIAKYLTNLEVREEPWVHLYPNPVTDRVKIEVMLPEKIKFIALLDQSGRLIKTYDNQSNVAVMDMKIYSPGIYLLRIELGSGASPYRKLLKK